MDLDLIPIFPLVGKYLRHLENRRRGARRAPYYTLLQQIGSEIFQPQRLAILSLSLYQEEDDCTLSSFAASTTSKRERRMAERRTAEAERFSVHSACTLKDCVSPWRRLYVLQLIFSSPRKKALLLLQKAKLLRFATVLYLLLF